MLYSAPHEPGYFPPVQVGIVVSTGSTRAVVKFPWGHQFPRISALKPARCKPSEHTVDALYNSVDGVL